MDEMTRWQRIVDRFLRSEGLSSGAVTAIELVALIVLRYNSDKDNSISDKKSHDEEHS